MNRDPRGGLGHIRLAHSLAYFAAVKQDPIAAHAGLEENAGVVRQFDQGGFVVEGYIPFDRLQRQGAVHGAAFQIYVAQLARQARCNRALARAGRAVDGNDELACGGRGHRGR